MPTSPDAQMAALTLTPAIDLRCRKSAAGPPPFTTSMSPIRTTALLRSELTERPPKATSPIDGSSNKTPTSVPMTPNRRRRLMPHTFEPQRGHGFLSPADIASSSSSSCQNGSAAHLTTADQLQGRGRPAFGGRPPIPRPCQLHPHVRWHVPPFRRREDSSRTSWTPAGADAPHVMHVVRPVTPGSFKDADDHIGSTRRRCLRDAVISVQHHRATAPTAVERHDLDSIRQRRVDKRPVVQFLTNQIRPFRKVRESNW